MSALRAGEMKMDSRNVLLLVAFFFFPNTLSNVFFHPFSELRIFHVHLDWIVSHVIKSWLPICSYTILLNITYIIFRSILKSDWNNFSPSVLAQSVIES